MRKNITRQPDLADLAASLAGIACLGAPGWRLNGVIRGRFI
jgi:hypothetical protein